jgi:Glycine zipper
MDAMLRTGTVLTLALAGATGCSTMNNTEKGALVGGGVGTVVGTAIGAATGNPRTGAAVGALGGATLGALAGNKQDERDRAVKRAEHAQPAVGPNAALGLIDVVNLSRGGTDPEVIAAQIRNTNSTFNLSTTDIEYLTQQGVAPRVIRAMQDSRGRTAPPQVIVREAPVIIERPVYPIYGPPAIGFHYSRRLR